MKCEVETCYTRQTISLKQSLTLQGGLTVTTATSGEHRRT